MNEHIPQPVMIQFKLLTTGITDTQTIKDIGNKLIDEYYSSPQFIQSVWEEYSIAFPEFYSK